MIFTAKLAVILVVWLLYGFTGILLLALIAFSYIFAKRSSSKKKQLLFVSFAAICLWFLCVHRTYEVHICPQCRYAIIKRTPLEILRIPLQIEKQYYPTQYSLMAESLGCPCSHPKMQIADHDDDWGLRVTWPLPKPYSPGILILGEEWERWHRDVISPLIQEGIRKTPEIVDEFQKKVFQEGDSEYYTYLYDDLLQLPYYEGDEEGREE